MCREIVVEEHRGEVNYERLEMKLYKAILECRINSVTWLRTEKWKTHLTHAGMENRR